MTGYALRMDNPAAEPDLNPSSLPGDEVPTSTSPPVSFHPDQIDPAAAHAERRRLWIEIFAILSVGVVPHLIHGISSFVGAQPQAAGVQWNAPNFFLSLGVGAIPSIACGLFIAWSSREHPSTFGFVRPKPAWDIVLVVAALVGAYASWWAYSASVGYYMQLFGTTPTVNDSITTSMVPPASLSDHMLFVASYVLNAAGEEIVLWAVLFTRVEKLLRVPVLDVLIVACVFASYHIYQGVFACGAIAFHGLVVGLLFRTTRRILPLIIAHATWDLILFYSYMTP